MQPGMQRACMTETEACEDCGVLDALDRHDPMCPRAIRLGLLRLAEGEAPIPPGEDEGEPGEIDGGDLPEPGAVALANLHTAITDHPGAIERAPAPREPELWISYRPEIGDIAGFDATVFETELDALRHAVETGAKVRRLELGKSLRKQVEDAPS